MRKLSHGAMAGDLAPLKRHPWVGLFHRGGQDRMSIPLYVKRAVLAEGKCRLCGSTENPHIDHIRPYSKGGTNERENLQRLCATCNTKKAAKWEGLQ
jgi:5-methylcytosine-specific restriction endonuclease McrA